MLPHCVCARSGTACTTQLEHKFSTILGVNVEDVMGAPAVLQLLFKDEVSLTKNIFDFF